LCKRRRVRDLGVGRTPRVALPRVGRTDCSLPGGLDAVERELARREKRVRFEGEK
jgi:hypothetical protein